MTTEKPRPPRTHGAPPITLSEHEQADAERRQQIALFRYGVIADLIHLEPGHRGLYALLRDKAAREWDIPGTLRRRVEAETIRGWLRDYRRGGFDALLPKARKDRGSARAIPQCVADVLCETKDQHPDFSVALVIEHVSRFARIPDDVVLAPSTVHRLLARAGLMQKKPGEPTSNDRRRFSFDQAGELWMSDVMHGPSVRIEGRQRKSYLLAMIDDATRIVPYASFAPSESVAAFLPVFEQAIRRRGIPKRLYVDNGAAFRSRHLALVCAKLGVTLIHARPYTPQGKGKMERWFRTVRMSLLVQLGADDTKSIEALNRRLWAWIEGEYHQSPHRGLDGEAPADRWAARSSDVRLADPGVADLFLFEQKRRVQSDRTVSLDGVVYEVDAVLVGDTVVLRYDPSRPRDRRNVQVWHRGSQIQLAKRVDAYANCFVRRNGDRRMPVADTPPDPPAQGLRMSDFQSNAADDDKAVK
ncbi:MAG: DDE-type integrase/transposase/recombinase [Polyangiaceae bacterium]|nr:DDE-type integrase/transposase/recombinase [Polyangiaceae bacterium]MCB9576793.1 DDE-type integrase/transposase/recombinase [Polyangiaceae bacterium]MCB9582185.1 DDE-type integrase/transposase/recombinase [Polyangiaceae bacterium]